MAGKAETLSVHRRNLAEHYAAKAAANPSPTQYNISK